METRASAGVRRWDLNLASTIIRKLKADAINPLKSAKVFQIDHNNFGPRVGLACRLGDKWVLRGGASIVYTGEYDNAMPLSVRGGFSNARSFASVDGGRTAPFLLKDGMPAVPKASEDRLKPGFGAVPIGKNPTFAVKFFEHTGRVVPYLATFNFNIQRQLTPNMLFEAGYLGTKGHKLVVPSSRTSTKCGPS